MAQPGEGYWRLVIVGRNRRRRFRRMRSGQVFGGNRYAGSALRLRGFIPAYDAAGTISLHLDIKRSASDSLVFRQVMLVDELPINIGPAGMMLKEPLMSSR